jgi:hypothetical protein
MACDGAVIGRLIDATWLIGVPETGIMFVMNEVDPDKSSKPKATDPNKGDRLLYPREAATFLSISEKQLRSLTSAGEIRYVNIGSGLKRETRRYILQDILDFIDRRRSGFQPGSTGQRKPAATIGVDFDEMLRLRRERKGRK